jgi:hypothetical protein
LRRHVVAQQQVVRDGEIRLGRRLLQTAPHQFARHGIQNQRFGLFLHGSRVVVLRSRDDDIAGTFGIPRPGARRGEVESLIVLDVHVDPFEADMKGEHDCRRDCQRPDLRFCWFHVS